MANLLAALSSRNKLVGIEPKGAPTLHKAFKAGRPGDRIGITVSGDSTVAVDFAL